MTQKEPWAIIVGAGPAGLLLGLLLARQHIPVRIVDQAVALDEQPRATHHGGPSIRELRRAGVLEEVRAKGFTPKSFCWRKLDGTYIAGLSTRLEANHSDEVVCLPLNELGKILCARIDQYKDAEILWNHRAVAIGQDDDIAWIDVETSEGRKTFKASYIVGCDGANSLVRRALFGEGEAGFPGKTWEEQLVATNTYYDFSKFGWKDSNFVIHPEHWYMAARISNEGLWRVSYGELARLTNEQLRQKQPEKFRAMLPGQPEPNEYRIVNFSPYRVHQRLAPRMRVGRFCLAADAAHICNPFGGLGLTGGIADIGCLYDCLIGIYNGHTDDSILDKYSAVRRQKYKDIIDPISSKNMLRLFTQDPDRALENDEFLQACKRAESDPEFARELQSGSVHLQHDFTQYYNKSLRNGYSN